MHFWRVDLVPRHVDVYDISKVVYQSVFFFKCMLYECLRSVLVVVVVVFQSYSTAALTPVRWCLLFYGVSCSFSACIHVFYITGFKMIYLGVKSQLKHQFQFGFTTFSDLFLSPIFEPWRVSLPACVFPREGYPTHLCMIDYLTFTLRTCPTLPVPAESTSSHYQQHFLSLSLLILCLVNIPELPTH